MIGGIYCESNLGPIYNWNTLQSIRQGMLKLFGDKNIVPRGEDLNEQIINYWYNDVSRRMSKILSSWKAPTNREYYNRTVDLTRSICLGVYHKGKLKRMYRFTGGSREKGMFEPSDIGSNDSPMSTFRMEMVSYDSHPNPASRAKQFLEEYDLRYKNDFSVVIAATMPYAVRLEATGSAVGRDGKVYRGYGLHVLKDVINRMLLGIYNFKGGGSGTIYGYVFESTGGYA